MKSHETLEYDVDTPSDARCSATAPRLERRGRQLLHLPILWHRNTNYPKLRLHNQKIEE
jgi:hypothetical protein